MQTGIEVPYLWQNKEIPHRLVKQSAKAPNKDIVI